MATITTTITLRDKISNNLTNIANKTRQATDNLDNMDRKLQSASKNTDIFSRKLQSLATTYLSFYGLSKVVELSDELSLSASRLNIVLDKMGEKTKSVADWQNEIYSAAQDSRASYVDMQKSVAKLGMLAGKAFKDTEEMTAFASQLNKMFILSGAGSREQSMAMYQLTQAMGSGRLQGDEYRSIIENAGYLAQAIENYMRNVEGATGTMKEWASEGLLTATVIKNAVAYAADETNKEFEKVGYTWAQVWQGIKNTAIRGADVVLKLINVMANNWDILRPIILGVAAAMLVYYAGVLLPTIAATIAKTIADWQEYAAVLALIAAQEGLNAAIAACPTTWIIMAIIALIALFYAAVAVVNKFAGTSYSATGIIAGAFFALGGIIQNVVAIIWNIIAAFVNFLGNAFRNPIAAIVTLFLDMATNVIDIIEKIAAAIDTVFGSNLSGAVSGFKDKITAASQYIKDKNGFVEYAKKMDLVSIKDMYGKGYNWGSNLSFGSGGSLGLGMSEDILSGIEDNTGRTADALDKDIADLEWLKRFAEQQAINQFTTAEIRVDMGGIQNNVNSNMDLDGMVDYLETTLTERMVSVAEGTHY